MKKCSSCGEIKDSTEFGKRTASKDGLKFKCLDCEREYRRERYLKDKERISKENKKGHQKRKERYYSYIKEYMNSDVFVCSSCGYTHTLHAPFDWHHIDPESKEYEVSSMVRHTKEKIFKELDKCILLCSNCHRILHYEEN